MDEHESPGSASTSSASGGDAVEPGAAAGPDAAAGPASAPGVSDGDERGVVEGVVLDADGTPVAGATVAFEAASGPAPDLAALTNAEGRFRLNRLPAGSHVISVRRGKDRVSAPAEVTAGDVTQVELRLPAPDAQG